MTKNEQIQKNFESQLSVISIHFKRKKKKIFCNKINK